MEANFVLIWIGALLIIGGVLHAASQVLWRGRLSDAGPRRSAGRRTSLEPQQSPRSFSLMTHWPAIALMLLGSLLIFIETAL